MKNLVWCVTLNLLFFVNAVYSSIQLTPSKSKTFKPSTTFTIQCNVTYTDGNQPTIKWKKDGVEVTTIKGLEDRAEWAWNKEKTINTLTVKDSSKNDAGNYSCMAYDQATGEEIARQDIAVAAHIAVDVPNNAYVVEEERLRIECKLIGKAALHWIFLDKIYDVSRDRVRLENFTYNDVQYENGVFIVENISQEDRGIVTCVAVETTTGDIATSQCMVRVKDKYAALWPFLGICAEVVILCAIIVIYEKKRNKTELEESDTDQSPDQKTNADHAKDTNLRHRQ